MKGVISMADIERMALIRLILFGVLEGSITPSEGLQEIFSLYRREFAVIGGKVYEFRVVMETIKEDIACAANQIRGQFAPSME